MFRWKASSHQGGRMIGTARKAEWGLPWQHWPFSRISCIPKYIQTSCLLELMTQGNRKVKGLGTTGSHPCPVLWTTSTAFQLTAEFSLRWRAAWVLFRVLLTEAKLMVGTWNGSFIMTWGVAVKLVMVNQAQLLPSAATASLLQFAGAHSLSKTLLARSFWV